MTQITHVAVGLVALTILLCFGFFLAQKSKHKAKTGASYNRAKLTKNTNNKARKAAEINVTRDLPERAQFDNTLSDQRGLRTQKSTVNRFQRTDLTSLADMSESQLLNDDTATSISTHIHRILDTGANEVSVSELLTLTGSDNTNFNRKRSVELAKILELLGFGIAPDPRIHGIKPHTSGTVKTFTLDDFDTTTVSAEFAYVVVLVHLTSKVSKADKLVLESEKELASVRISSNNSFSQYEKISLEYLFEWCFDNSYGYRGIKRVAKNLHGDDRLTIWRHLVNVAVVDKELDVRELAELQKIYDVLELDPLQKHVYLAAVSNAILTARRDAAPRAPNRARKNKIAPLQEDKIADAETEINVEIDDEGLDDNSKSGNPAWVGKFHTVSQTIHALDDGEYFNDRDWFERDTASDTDES